MFDIIPCVKANKFIPRGVIATYDVIECVNDHVTALLPITDNNEYLKNIKIGDTFPVKVRESLYDILKPKIIISAIPFEATNNLQEHVAYKLNKLTSDDKKFYEERLIPMLQSSITPNDNWDKFSKLILPKTPTEIKNGVDITKLQNDQTYQKCQTKIISLYPITTKLY
jgi:hypothetical protein